LMLAFRWGIFWCQSQLVWTRATWLLIWPKMRARTLRGNSWYPINPERKRSTTVSWRLWSWVLLKWIIFTIWLRRQRTIYMRTCIGKWKIKAHCGIFWVKYDNGNIFNVSLSLSLNWVTHFGGELHQGQFANACR
jgi:hypothetical protein